MDSRFIALNPSKPAILPPLFLILVHLLSLLSELGSLSESQRVRRIKVLRSLNLSNNVVSLAEKGVPVVQDGLLLVIQVLPFWLHIVLARAGLCKGAGSIVTGKHWYIVLVGENIPVVEELRFGKRNKG